MPLERIPLRPGEPVALVGPNGSGKSRLAQAWASRCGARYITFRDSYGSYGDRNFFMQQRWNLFTLEGDPPTTGERLAEEVASAADPAAARQRLDQLTGLFSLQPLLDKPLVTLSSGELRKFQLTRALLGGPAALSIDNPYIGLDPPTRALLTSLLERLSASTALVLVLSRVSEIPSFITHVIPVENGTFGEKTERQAYLDEVLPPAVIRMRGVTIRYGERVILDHLDWTVRQGEHWALTGANGSGKSTLLSLICADNPMAYACDIELFGRPRGSGESIWDIKRNIGFVSPELHRAFQVDAPALDIVTSGLFDTEGLFIRPTEEQRGKARRWMAAFGIEDLAGRPFLRLSSGEQRLCLVARAFVKDPPLYILDEPLHGLDEAQRLRVKGLLDRYCAAPGKTLLMVTHCPEEYPACIDHSLTLAPSHAAAPLREESGSDRIREMKTWDSSCLEDLLSLMRELSEEHTVTEEMLRTVVNSPDCHLYLLRDGGKIAGCATLCVFTSPTGRKASIEDVVVHSSFRGRGFGRRLMEHVLQEARREAPLEVHLTSRPSRVAANALYRSLGFTRRDTNAYVMVL